MVESVSGSIAEATSNIAKVAPKSPSRRRAFVNQSLVPDWVAAIGPGLIVALVAGFFVAMFLWPLRSRSSLPS